MFAHPDGQAPRGDIRTVFVQILQLERLFLDVFYPLTGLHMVLMTVNVLSRTFSMTPRWSLNIKTTSHANAGFLRDNQDGPSDSSPKNKLTPNRSYK